MSTNAFEQPVTAMALLSLVGEVATASFAQTLPPGARICFDISGVLIHGKVVRQVRTGDASLTTTIRVNSLSKFDRATLEKGFDGAEVTSPV